MEAAQHEGRCELKVLSVEGSGLLLSSTDASIREEAMSSVLSGALHDCI